MLAIAPAYPPGVAALGMCPGGWFGGPRNLIFRLMNGQKNDIDPATALAEPEDEPSLPELEHESAVDLAGPGSGPLAAGRAAIARHAKHAPSAPGVYRMIDANGEVLYVGKAKNIRKRIVSYTRPTGYDSRIERMIAATASLDRDRDGSAAP
jgi:excinuclease ABC subunit C